MTAQYRATVRRWLTEHAPASPPAKADYVAASKRFTRGLYDAGLVGVEVPAQYGGQGLGPEEADIVREEVAELVLPTAIFQVGLNMCVPILLEYGTEEQKHRLVRPILDGTEVWCQLFSEPDAGSDLAGLTTTARTEGTGFVVNGQKLWTSGAQHSDWGVMLARTDPDRPKHKGISMLIIDLHAPGVEVRPLRDITGIPHFNEVFFDNVEVGPEALLGELNEGWSVARRLLTHERLAVTRGIRTDDTAEALLGFDGLRRLAEKAGTAHDPAAREELLDLYLLDTGIARFNQRVIDRTQLGEDPGVSGSIGKLLAARRERQAAALTARVSRGETTAHDGRLSDTVQAALYALNLSLGGGTDEIQRNIIAERHLGLPREQQPPTDVSFREAIKLQEKEWKNAR